MGVDRGYLASLDSRLSDEAVPHPDLDFAANLRRSIGQQIMCLVDASLVRVLDRYNTEHTLPGLDGVENLPKSSERPNCNLTSKIALAGLVTIAPSFALESNAYPRLRQAQLPPDHTNLLRLPS
jgi:hypothetical protein